MSSNKRITAFFDMTGPSGGRLYLIRRGKVERETAFRIVDGKAALAEDVPMPGFGEAVLSLPLSMLYFRFLEFPFAEADGILEALPYELEGITLKGPEGIVFDAVMPEKPAAPARVLAVYADKAMLSSLIRSLEEIGADPRTITSLELGRIVKAGGDIAGALMDNALPPDNQRPSLAEAETASPLINLRKGDLAYKKEEERLARSLRTSALLAALILAVLAAESGLKAKLAGDEARALEKNLRSRYFEILPPGTQPSVRAFEGRIAELKRKNKALGVNTLAMLSDITGLRVKEVVFKEIDIATDGVVIRAEAPSLAVAEAQRGALAKKFTRAEVLESNTLSEKAVSFTLRAGL